MSDGPATQLDVRRVGSGPPVVFVHGSIVGAERTWRDQLPLAERWTLLLANRPGFGASPALPRNDFEAEAPAVADLLGEGAHLVGHSYGAVIALWAAALRPGAVRSLTISEPGCQRVAAGDPRVDEMISNGDRFFAATVAGEVDHRDVLRMFRYGVGSTHETPAELPEELLAGVRLLATERPAWDGEPPLEALADTPFPKLVVSGGHSDVFDLVCDRVAERIGAERAVVPGRGHTIPRAGAAYNTELERVLRAGEVIRAGEVMPDGEFGPADD